MKNGRLNSREREQLMRARDLLNRFIDQREALGKDFENDRATDYACTAVVSLNEVFYETRDE